MITVIIYNHGAFEYAEQEGSLWGQEEHFTIIERISGMGVSCLSFLQ
jgi:hypothetical protein